MTRFLPETGQPRIPRMNRSVSDHDWPENGLQAETQPGGERQPRTGRHLTGWARPTSRLLARNTLRPARAASSSHFRPPVRTRAWQDIGYGERESGSG